MIKGESGMRLRFIGQNGSMGLVFGKVYRLKIEPWNNGVQITAPRVCPYASDEAFWRNWAHPAEDIRGMMEARGAELRKIHIPHDAEAEVTSHVTRKNPSGSVQQCDRRDIHEPHEWQAEFGSYFDVYCPGNDGTTQ